MENSLSHSDRMIGREEMIAYLEGGLDELSKKEFMGRVEKDLFAAEALEGLEAVGATKAQALIGDLDRRLNERGGASSRRVINPLYKLGAAAAILLLGAFFVFQKVDLGLSERNMATAQPAQERSTSIVNEEPEAAERGLTAFTDEADVESEEEIETIIEPALSSETAKIQSKTRPKANASGKTKKDEAKPIVGLEVEDLEEDDATSAIGSEIAEEVLVVASPMGRKKSPASITIQKGVIRDLNGKPVANARISEKGSQQSVLTDAMGSFQMNLTSEKGSFQIVADGFLVQEIPAKPDQNLLVLMKPSSANKAAEPAVGYAAYQKYLSTNLRFPPDAKDKEISGQVLISFKVGSDGSISSIKVKEKLFPSCDTEAIRLVKEGPKWAPASKKGSPTSSRQTVSVLFR